MISRLSKHLPLLISCCAALAAWLVLRMLPDSFILPVFCRIPAELAARYYNAELQTPGLLFSVRGTVFEVARTCAATDFFSMVAGLLTYLWLKSSDGILPLPKNKTPQRQDAVVTLLFALAILPLAWGIALFANTIRLIFIVPATFFVYDNFSRKTFAASHQAFGTLVFLTVFIILWEGIRYVIRKKNT
jgi:exosortase/archaeosortase family protein